MPSGREKKIKIDDTCRFHIAGNELPASDTSTLWRYLGISFSAAGRRCLPVDRELQELLTKVSKAPLKPQQRLVVLRFYLLPRLYHRLTLGPWSCGLLARLDVYVRKAVRKWLALPHDVPLGYFYAQVGEGGLGIPNLRTTIPGMQGRRLHKLTTSTSPAVRESMRCRLLIHLLKRAQEGSSFRSVQLPTRAAVAAFWRANLHRSVDGRALKDCADVPYAHHWVAEGTRLLPGRAFIDVVKLRINAMPTLTRLRRGKDRGDGVVTCRAGCGVRETLGHVLQECFRTHALRIERHNSLVRYLAERLRTLGWSVSVEPHFKTALGTRIPDLVLRRDGASVILDIHIVGTNIPMSRSHSDKVSYYTIPDLLYQIQGDDASPPLVLAATVNFRGVWHSEAAQSLRDLGISKSDFKLMSIRCLQGGVKSFFIHQKSCCVSRGRR